MMLPKRSSEPNLIDIILEFLSDGQRHDLNELSVAEQLRKVSITKLIETLRFLAKYDFIELDEVWKGDPERPVLEAKLTSSVQTFIGRIKWIERAEHQRFFSRS